MTRLYSVYTQKWSQHQDSRPSRVIRTTSYEKALEALGELLAIDPPPGAVKTRVEVTLEVELLD